MRFAFAANALALLATSDPEGPAANAYRFSKGLQGPATTLTAAAPTARFRVIARATGLAPDGSPTTSNADAMVSGEVTAGGVGGSGSLVTVRATTAGGPEEALNVATSFSLPRALRFEGDCLTPAGCVAELDVEFSRTDAGSNGGAIEVEWSIGFSAEVQKTSPPSEQLELPWTIEVTRQ